MEDKLYTPTTYRTTNNPMRRDNRELLQGGIPSNMIGDTVRIGNAGKDWKLQRSRLDMDDESFAAFLLKISSYTDTSIDEDLSEKERDLKEFTEMYKAKKDQQRMDDGGTEPHYIKLGKFINLWQDRKDLLKMNDEAFASYLLHLWKYIASNEDVMEPVESLGGSESPYAPQNKEMAYVTVATDDNYALGALVLGHSLRQVQTQKKLVILITNEVSEAIRMKLKKVYDEVRDTSLLDSNDQFNLTLMGRPELGKTFTKLHIWQLTEYKKCVFLDADTLVVKNCDELFTRDELSAVPDVGWPDCFNSGVFVFVPSRETYSELLRMASEVGSFDGGDQGLLNMYFDDWATKNIANHLSFIYNMVVNATYTYIPAYNHYGHRVKIIHFLGAMKPWLHNHGQGSAENFQPCERCRECVEHLRLWWDIFARHVLTGEAENAEMEICQELSNVCIGMPGPSTQGASAGAGTSRKTNWELGQVDYLGADSFDNIQRKLDQAMQKDNN